MTKRQTDEEAYPEKRLRDLIDEVLQTKDWGKEFELVITTRKGRSERVTLIWSDKSRVSVTHRSRKPGLARAGLSKLLTDLRDAAKKVSDTIGKKQLEEVMRFVDKLDLSEEDRQSLFGGKTHDD